MCVSQTCPVVVQLGTEVSHFFLLWLVLFCAQSFGNVVHATSLISKSFLYPIHMVFSCAQSAFEHDKLRKRPLKKLASLVT